MGQGLEIINEDTTTFTGCCLTSWAGGAYRAGAGLLLEEVTEEGGRRVEVKAFKARRLAAAHYQAVNLVSLLLLLTPSIVLLFNVLKGTKSTGKPAAGPEEEPIDAGAENGALLLVALIVEHAHPRVRLSPHSAFCRLDFELCGDGSFSFEDIILVMVRTGSSWCRVG